MRNTIRGKGEHALKERKEGKRKEAVVLLLKTESCHKGLEGRGVVKERGGEGGGGKGEKGEKGECRKGERGAKKKKTWRKRYTGFVLSMS